MAAKDRTSAGARASSKSQGRPAQDACALLENDHREVDGHFEDFKAADTAQAKKRIAQAICNALRVHAQIEEELFYPAARKALKDKDLLDEAVVEHAGAKVLIAEIEAMQPGMPLYDAKVTVLGEQVRHHVREEEGELFPKLREARIDLVTLGAQMAERKFQLVALLSAAALA